MIWGAFWGAVWGGVWETVWGYDLGTVWGGGLRPPPHKSSVGAAYRPPPPMIYGFQTVPKSSPQTVPLTPPQTAPQIAPQIFPIAPQVILIILLIILPWIHAWLCGRDNIGFRRAAAAFSTAMQRAWILVVLLRPPSPEAWCLFSASSRVHAEFHGHGPP